MESHLDAAYGKSRRSAALRWPWIGVVLAVVVVDVGCAKRRPAENRNAPSDTAWSPISSAAYWQGTNSSTSSPASSATASASPPVAAGECNPGAGGRVFDVGEGKPLRSLGEVSWSNLNAGDAVRIHWRPEAYHEKIVVTAQGVRNNPIRICGVPGPQGQLPVLDGRNAATASSAVFYHPVHEQRGLITISALRRGDNLRKAQHVVIQGLELRNASEPHQFRTASGQMESYFPNAGCVFVERGEHIVIRGNHLHGCGNGIFVACGGGPDEATRDILIEGNHIHDNGSTGNRRDRDHNTYTEALGIVYQFNRFGPVREGSEGLQLKDRSAGNVIRYNWFEGGKRVLDLVEPQESYELARQEPAFNRTYVYGNVLVLGEDAASRVVHYGGDSGDSRNGTLFFYNNTVAISTAAAQRWHMSMFFLTGPNETAIAANNIIYSSKDTNLYWLYDSGKLQLGRNWVSSSIRRGRDDVTGTVEHLGGQNRTILGTDPGFVDFQAGNYCLGASSPARGIGDALKSIPNELQPTLQFRPDLGPQPRESVAGGALGALACD